VSCWVILLLIHCRMIKTTVMVSVFLMTGMLTSCSVIIDGIFDAQEHQASVDQYKRRGYSEGKAEKLADEDEFFADMESRRFEEPPKKEEYTLKLHEDEY
jgi:hypothetical protein